MNNWPYYNLLTTPCFDLRLKIRGDIYPATGGDIISNIFGILK